jgi:hypothetical protein
MLQSGDTLTNKCYLYQIVYVFTMQNTNFSE